MTTAEIIAGACAAIAVLVVVLSLAVESPYGCYWDDGLEDEDFCAGEDDEWLR